MRTPLRIGNNEADPRRNYAARSRRYRNFESNSDFEISIFHRRATLYLFIFFLSRNIRNWKLLKKQLYKLVDIYFDPKVFKTSEFFQIFFLKPMIYRNQFSSRMQERYVCPWRIERFVEEFIKWRMEIIRINHLIWNIVKISYFPLDEKICNLLHEHHQGWSLVEYIFIPSPKIYGCNNPSIQKYRCFWNH